MNHQVDEDGVEAASVEGLGPDVAAELEQVCSVNLSDLVGVQQWREQCAGWRSGDFMVDDEGGIDCKRNPFKYYFF